jgi:hypothetical protein
MRAGLKGLTAMAVVAGALMVSAVPASATTLGQLAATPNGCVSNFDDLQPAVSSGASYAAPSAGTITSWSTQTFGSLAQTETFKVYRPVAGAFTYKVVAHDSRTLATPALNTFPVNIAVEAGDLIGLHPDSGFPTCSFVFTGDNAYQLTGNLQDGQQGGPFNVYANRRINVTAQFTATTGQRAAALKKCKKKIRHNAKKRRKCRKKANRLPV